MDLLGQASRRATSIARRTLFIGTEPPAASFRDRRAVLAALKRQGPIEIFKLLPVGSPEQEEEQEYNSSRGSPVRMLTPGALANLQRNPPVFMVVTETGVLAGALIAASPLIIDVMEPSESVGAAADDALLDDGLARKQRSDLLQTGLRSPPAVFPSRGRLADEETPPQNRSDAPVTLRQITLHISHFGWYKHRATIESAAHHGPWRPTTSPGDGLGRWVLERSVPAGVVRKGLLRWDDDGRGRGVPRTNDAMAKLRKEIKARHQAERRDLLPGVMSGTAESASTPNEDNLPPSKAGDAGEDLTT